MNEENYFKATSNLSRITESGLLRFMPRIVYNSCHRNKKQRVSRLFIFLSLSKEQGNRTGNPKFACGSFRFLLCIPCPAGLRPPAPAPDGRTLVRLSRKSSFHLPVVASVPACPAIGIAGMISITLKDKCYGKQGRGEAETRSSG